MFWHEVFSGRDHETVSFSLFRYNMELRAGKPRVISTALKGIVAQER